MSKGEAISSDTILRAGEFGLMAEGVLYKGRAAEEKLGEHMGALLVEFRKSVLGKSEDTVRQYDGTVPAGTHFSLMYESHPGSHISHFCTPGFLKKIFAGYSDEAVSRNYGHDILPEILDVEFNAYLDEHKHHMIGVVAHITIPHMADDVWKDVAEITFSDIDVQGRLMAGQVSGLILGNQKLDLRPRGFQLF